MNHSCHFPGYDEICSITRNGLVRGYTSTFAAGLYSSSAAWSLRNPLVRQLHVPFFSALLRFFIGQTKPATAAVLMYFLLLPLKVHLKHGQYDGWSALDSMGSRP